ncbi:MAG: 4-hydroxythreonine-4-phosphate dehydrogenase PdxA [Candidatus Sumerlaeia bacterium]|nr:4-hydroxythreonine-4-phosphate dehydrogenase PdxA [Candidatus Sumerlaeia bacterium]
MRDGGQKPRIAISLGDPSGIGPEIALKAVARGEINEICTPVLVGSPAVCEAVLATLHLPLRLQVVSEVRELVGKPEVAHVLCPAASKDASAGPVGKVSAESGQLAFEAIDEAVRRIQQGEFDALCTAPISKAALNLAGHAYPGHTELLAEKAGAPRVAMLMVGGGVRVVPATIHCPLSSVPSRLTQEDLVELLELIHRAMETDFAIAQARVAVCGVNPHAGEDGLLGSEERAIIAPAIAEAQRRGIRAEGPVPADVVYHQMRQGRWDCVLAMYHDQAMIPVKTLAFDRGVNVTLGLPFVRTSPDHGTAFDIAGRGTARPYSMIAALQLAAELTQNRWRRNSRSAANWPN